LESLFQAGAFDMMNTNRNQLLSSLDTIISYGSRVQEMDNSNQNDLFGDGGNNSSAINEPDLAEVERWSNIERLNRERELIGFYLSGHPLNKYEEDIDLFCSHKLKPETLQNLRPKEDVRVAGIITSVKPVTDRKGRPFAFLQIEDLYGTIEVIAFNDVYDRYLGMIQVDNIVVVDGNTDDRGGQPKIIANTFERIESMREKNQRNLQLMLRINTDRVSQENLKEIATLFDENKGDTPIQFVVESTEAKRPFKMNVRKFVIEPTDELMKGLREIVGQEDVKLQRAENHG
jgi:DNA polymerase-3 subunit alpha